MKYIVTAMRDVKMYEKCIGRNDCLLRFTKCSFDNRQQNIPVPSCYNRFIESHETDESWFLFCHEDFEFLENVEPLLERFDKSSLHGVIGGVRKGFAGFGVQKIYGNMTEVNRDGSGAPWTPGRKISHPVEVEAFDCCCLIVHSSLVVKYGLRFDENLLFDLYVEDFCALAKVKHGIKSYVHPVKCCHHSGSRATGRLYRHLPYLKKKYPKNCFVGTLTYFGTPTWQKRLQDRVVSAARSFGKR